MASCRIKLMAYDMIFGIEWDKAATGSVKGGEERSRAGRPAFARLPPFPLLHRLCSCSLFSTAGICQLQRCQQLSAALSYQ